MKLSWLSCTFILAGLTAASLATGGSVGEWTVFDARRTKSQDNKFCAWQFALVDSSPEANASIAFQCDFDVTTPSGEDCGLGSFSNNSCSGNEAFSINGGHSDLGFVVMLLIHLDQRSQAWYGFADSALDSGSVIPQQIKQSYPLGNTRRNEIAVRQSGGGSYGPPTKWTVEDMFRDVDVQKHLVTVGFRIIDGTPGGSRCVLVLTPPEGVDMQTWEWYNRECGGSGYFASWGYMASSDAGIMTIVNPSRDSQAFFGFANIHSGSYLGDAGPSPVSSCSCG
ncbi:hypothetical protein F4677DRAFT_445389 [Hypoxylon crocopeplum]|nr:hypothetical protein F4677DRAFT_445389 [Hypoxylon crocopeplum]